MGDALENLIAVEMAVGVIYQFEVVEIDEDERKRGGLSEAFVPVLLEALIEGVAIGEAGESVALCDLEKLLVGAVEIVDEDVVLKVMEVGEPLVAIDGVVGDDGDGGGTEYEEETEDFLFGIKERVEAEKDEICDDHDVGDRQGVGETQPHGDVGEEHDGENAEWSIGGCYGSDVALDEEVGDACETGDEGDAGLAKEAGRMKEHADVDAESERSDDSGANEEGLLELNRVAEVICDEEEVEQNDGDESFKP